MRKHTIAAVVLAVALSGTAAIAGNGRGTGGSNGGSQWKRGPGASCLFGQNLQARRGPGAGPNGQSQRRGKGNGKGVCDGTGPKGSGPNGSGNGVCDGSGRR